MLVASLPGLAPSPGSLPLLRLRGGFGVGLATSAFESYTRLLTTAPLATNCVSASCLGMLSDGIAQSLTPVNFKLIAPRFGVLWTNAAFVVWTTYLSLVANRAGRAK